MQRDLDVVLHLGGYIYEGSGSGAVRRYTRPVETLTLEDYRVRHTDYKRDPDLQAAHAAFPLVLTWDDHKVDNNYASDDSDPDSPPGQFLQQRAAA